MFLILLIAPAERRIKAPGGFGGQNCSGWTVHRRRDFFLHENVVFET
jgi:hypothetical protein